MKRWLLLFSIAALAACGGDSAPEAPDERVEITGEAYFLERIMMPPGSTLEVELLDEASGERLAMERVEGPEAPPYPFGLSVPADALQADQAYVLHLTLFLPDGSPRFAAEVPVTANADELGRIRLIGVDYSEADPDRDEPMADWHAFQCGDVAVDAQFDGDESAVLSLPWALRELELQPAASGARYVADEVEFWTRGQDQARLTLADDQALDCVPRDRVSPWTQAMIDSVDFRAVGNEPGWHLEVRHGDADLHLVLDYGSSELEFPGTLEILPDQAGYRAESPGNLAEVTLEQADCTDTMVGWTFPITVHLQINDRSMSACGRFLN